MDLEQIKAKKAELDSAVKEMFSTFLKELFQNTPELKLVTWTQYTPYFNDGDACVFRVNEPEISVFDGLEDEHLGYDNLYCEGKYYSIFSAYHHEEEFQKYGSIFDEMENIVSEIEPYLQEMFGDHSRVIVFADRIVVESYSHG